MVRTYQEKEEEEAAVKDRGSGTITGDPTPTGSPGPRTRSSSWVLWGLFRKHKQPCTFFFSFHALSVLKCTDVNKHAVAARGKTISHEEKPHNEHTFCCRLAGFLVRGNEAGPNQTASGGILRQTYVLMYCSLLRRLIFLHFKSTHHYILPAALKYYIMSLTLMAVFDPDLICNAIPASLIKSEPFAL